MSVATKRKSVCSAIIGMAISGTGALATTVDATDPSQIGCPLASLTDAERAGLDQHIIEQGPNDDPRRRRFLAAIESCAARFHWSRNFSEYAFRHNFVTEMLVATRRLFAERRVEIRELERLLLADPALAHASGVDARTAAIQDFVRRHQVMAAGLVQGRPNPDQILGAIGVFLFARAMQEELRNTPVME